MNPIRIATESDSEAIARLVNKAFLVERFFIERDRTDPPTVRNMMIKGKFLLVEAGPSLIGGIYAELRAERGYFGMLSIDPSRQRKGFGRQLVQAVEKYFQDAGCKFSDLKIVNVRNDLHEMYRRWGYIDTGSDAYDDPTPTKIPVHFINMSKPL